MDRRKRSRRRSAFHDPGHAHELTFSCYRGYPFLQAERTCRWLAEAIEAGRRQHSLAAANLNGAGFGEDFRGLPSLPPKLTLPARRACILQPVGDNTGHVPSESAEVMHEPTRFEQARPRL